ncbi:MAG: hypothetical protein K8W52_10750, partial [Deltaproteobacteria bacterium]|nr:hypothetical protein [Deltaproteobacteria bacterium]
MRGWILGLTIAAGCAGHAHRRAPRPTGLAPSRTATVIAPVAIAPVVTAPEARAPLAMAPIAPRPIEGVAALALGDRAVVRALNQ